MLSLNKVNPIKEDPSIQEVWQECMLVAPGAIQLLGQLLVVSSVKDISLQSIANTMKFYYVRNPESLRATLLQISFDGYNAFLAAHKSMNVIQLTMQQIPKYIKRALEFLSSDYSYAALNRVLSSISENIKLIGDECVSSTNEINIAFFQAKQVIEEVILAIRARELERGNVIKENKLQCKFLKNEQEALKAEEERRSKLYKEASEIVNRAEADYEKALKNSEEKQPNHQIEEEVLTEIRDISKQMRPSQVANQLSDPIDSINTTNRSREELDENSNRNEVLKAHIAQKSVADMRKRQDKYADDITKTLEEIRKMNRQILEIDIRNISHNQITEMLEEAADLFSKLQQKRHQFILFFNTLSEQIKNLINHSLKIFSAYAPAEKLTERDHRLNLIRQLKEDTFSIYNESYKYSVLSQTYCEISSKYLMKPLSSLATMLATRSFEEKEKLRENLRLVTENSIQDIQSLINERNKLLDKELQTRSQALNELLDQVGKSNKSLKQLRT